MKHVSQWLIKAALVAVCAGMTACSTSQMGSGITASHTAFSDVALSSSAIQEEQKADIGDAVVAFEMTPRTVVRLRTEAQSGSGASSVVLPAGTPLLRVSTLEGEDAYCAINRKARTGMNAVLWGNNSVRCLADDDQDGAFDRAWLYATTPTPDSLFVTHVGSNVPVAQPARYEPTEPEAVNFDDRLAVLYMGPISGKISDDGRVLDGMVQLDIRPLSGDNVGKSVAQLMTGLDQQGRGRLEWNGMVIEFERVEFDGMATLRIVSSPHPDIELKTIAATGDAFRRLQEFRKVSPALYEFLMQQQKEESGG